MKKYPVSWTAKALTKQMIKGKIVFDNAIQRNLCWDIDRKSLLIHTMLDDFPIPHFYAVKSANDGYDMLDGKQRSHAILSYISDEFGLSEVAAETTLESGEAYELTGKKFSELPEELQDRICDYSINGYYFEDITDEQIVDLFFRINNGKAFSPIELTRVRAVSLEQIREAAKHEIFKVALTAKALEKYTNEDLIIKTWAMLNVESPSLSTKDIRPLMETVTFQDEEIIEMLDIYDTMLKVYQHIKDSKGSAKTAKKMLTRTHFLALVPIVRQSIADKISVEDFSKWVQSFFTGDKTASISAEYNETTMARTTNRDSITKRHNAIMSHYRAFVELVDKTVTSA